LMLSRSHKTKLYFDLSFFEFKETLPSLTPRSYELHIFGIEAIEKIVHPVKPRHSFRYNPLVRKLEYQIFNNVLLCIEESFTPSSLFNKLKPPVYLIGYFQSEKYFESDKESIASAFRFRLPLSVPSTDIRKKILDAECAVSIHIRRGDYINDPAIASFLGGLPIMYYQRAIELVSQHFKKCSFFIFSDDANWARANLTFIRQPAYFVNVNKGTESWQDMALMSHCKHNIIANSTFSWWGAWLNNNPCKMVIAPKKWFQTNNTAYSINSIVPDNWISI